MKKDLHQTLQNIVEEETKNLLSEQKASQLDPEIGFDELVNLFRHRARGKYKPPKYIETAADINKWIVPGEAGSYEQSLRKQAEYEEILRQLKEQEANPRPALEAATEDMDWEIEATTPTLPRMSDEQLRKVYSEKLEDWGQKNAPGYENFRGEGGVFGDVDTDTDFEVYYGSKAERLWGEFTNALMPEGEDACAEGHWVQDPYGACVTWKTPMQVRGSDGKPMCKDEWVQKVFTVRDNKISDRHNKEKGAIVGGWSEAKGFEPNEKGYKLGYGAAPTTSKFKGLPYNPEINKALAHLLPQEFEERCLGPRKSAGGKVEYEESNATYKKMMEDYLLKTRDSKSATALANNCAEYEKHCEKEADWINASGAGKRTRMVATSAAELGAHAVESGLAWMEGNPVGRYMSQADATSASRLHLMNMLGGVAFDTYAENKALMDAMTNPDGYKGNILERLAGRYSQMGLSRLGGRTGAPLPGRAPATPQMQNFVQRVPESTSIKMWNQWDEAAKPFLGKPNYPGPEAERLLTQWRKEGFQIAARTQQVIPPTYPPGHGPGMVLPGEDVYRHGPGPKGTKFAVHRRTWICVIKYHPKLPAVAFLEVAPGVWTPFGGTAHLGYGPGTAVGGPTGVYFTQPTAKTALIGFPGYGRQRVRHPFGPLLRWLSRNIDEIDELKRIQLSAQGRQLRTNVEDLARMNTWLAERGALRKDWLLFWREQVASIEGSEKYKSWWRRNLQRLFPEKYKKMVKLGILERGKHMVGVVDATTTPGPVFYEGSYEEMKEKGLLFRSQELGQKEIGLMRDQARIDRVAAANKLAEGDPGEARRLYNRANQLEAHAKQLEQIESYMVRHHREIDEILAARKARHVSQTVRTKLDRLRATLEAEKGRLLGKFGSPRYSAAEIDAILALTEEIYVLATKGKYSPDKVAQLGRMLEVAWARSIPGGAAGAVSGAKRAAVEAAALSQEVSGLTPSAWNRLNKVGGKVLGKALYFLMAVGAIQEVIKLAEVRDRATGRYKYGPMEAIAIAICISLDPTGSIRAIFYPDEIKPGTLYCMGLGDAVDDPNCRYSNNEMENDRKAWAIAANVTATMGKRTSKTDLARELTKEARRLRRIGRDAEADALGAHAQLVFEQGVDAMALPFDLGKRPTWLDWPITIKDWGDDRAHDVSPRAGGPEGQWVYFENYSCDQRYWSASLPEGLVKKIEPAYEGHPMCIRDPKARVEINKWWESQRASGKDAIPLGRKYVSTLGQLGGTIASYGLDWDGSQFLTWFTAWEQPAQLGRLTDPAQLSSEAPTSWGPSMDPSAGVTSTSADMARMMLSNPQTREQFLKDYEEKLAQVGIKFDLPKIKGAFLEEYKEALKARGINIKNPEGVSRAEVLKLLREADTQRRELLLRFWDPGMPVPPRQFVRYKRGPHSFVRLKRVNKRIKGLEDEYSDLKWHREYEMKGARGQSGPIRLDMPEAHSQREVPTFSEKIWNKYNRLHAEAEKLQADTQEYARALQLTEKKPKAMSIEEYEAIVNSRHTEAGQVGRDLVHSAMGENIEIFVKLNQLSLWAGSDAEAKKQKLVNELKSRTNIRKVTMIVGSKYGAELIAQDARAQLQIWAEQEQAIAELRKTLSQDDVLRAMGLFKSYDPSRSPAMAPIDDPEAAKARREYEKFLKFQDDPAWVPEGTITQEIEDAAEMAALDCPSREVDITYDHSTKKWSYPCAEEEETAEPASAPPTKSTRRKRRKPKLTKRPRPKRRSKGKPKGTKKRFRGAK